MAQINLRIDDDTKRHAEVTRENKTPFELSADPFYSRENMAELERRAADVRSGKSHFKEHDLVENYKKK